jgi:hypothetical protein
MASVKNIAVWRNTLQLGHSVSLTATGRVVLHRPGGTQELTHFSKRWLDRKDDMIRIVGDMLEGGYERVKPR